MFYKEHLIGKGEIMVLGIYCAGGFGGTVLELARELNEDSNRWDNIYFINDVVPSIETEVEVLSFEEFTKLFSPQKAEIIIASGEPFGRLKLFDKVKEKGYTLPNMIHPSSVTAFKVSRIGEGNIIQDFVHISPSNVEIGNNNVFMTFSRIAHDCRVGNHCVFTSSTNCSGRVNVEDGCYIGTGAKLRDKINIKRNAIIGMGAIVIKSVTENSVVVGNPAKEIRKNTGHVF